MNLHQAAALLRKRRTSSAPIFIFDLYADGQPFATYCARSRPEAVAYGQQRCPNQKVTAKEIKL